ncbi:MAG: hypothetical protein WCX88_01415 [Patescibacteria group bacterium]
MFGRILLGLVIMGVGLLISLKSNAFLNFFGPIGWAEKFFSHGSSTGYKFLGIIVFFIGLFVATNLMNSILMSIFGGMMGVN